MKLIVAGTRTFDDYELLKKEISELDLDITQIISGHANGADKLGEKYAHEIGLGCVLFPAKWDFYGKQAGPIRNREMAGWGDFLIAFWDGESPGTKHMIDEMERRNKPVRVVLYKQNTLC